MFGREFTSGAHRQHVLPPSPTRYSFERVGSTPRVAGTEKVRGEAQVGDFVTYYDIANQSGDVWEVVSLPNDPSNIGPTGYVMSDYGLENVNTGAPHWSDLRQVGWTFASDLDQSRHSSKSAGWLLDDIAEMSGMSTALGNGWEIINGNGGVSISRYWGDYDGASITPPAVEGDPWKWNVHARLYQVHVGSGSANTVEEAMSMCEETYADYKRTASRKTAEWGMSPDGSGDEVYTNGKFRAVILERANDVVAVYYEGDNKLEVDGKGFDKYPDLETAKHNSQVTVDDWAKSDGFKYPVASRKTSQVFTEWMAEAYPGTELLDLSRADKSRVLNEYKNEVGEGNEVWASRRTAKAYFGKPSSSSQAHLLQKYSKPSKLRGLTFEDLDGLEEFVKAQLEACPMDSIEVDDVLRGIKAARKWKEKNGYTANRRTAFLDTVHLAEPKHRVAGWDWDDHLNGFIAAEAAREFTCACGDNVPAPGYTDCRCGKRWNAYTVSANGSKKMIAREVPVRENVVMARRAASRKYR